MKQFHNNLPQISNGLLSRSDSAQFRTTSTSSGVIILFDDKPEVNEEL